MLRSQESENFASFWLSIVRSVIDGCQLMPQNYILIVTGMKGDSSPSFSLQDDGWQLNVQARVAHNL